MSGRLSRILIVVPAVRNNLEGSISPARRLDRNLLTSLVLNLALVPIVAVGGRAADSPRTSARALSEPPSSSVLTDCYEGLLRDQDVEKFRRGVASRYTETTLARMLEASATDASRAADSDRSLPAKTSRLEAAETQVRRAAVLALGLLGTYESSNAVVARALRDSDPTVRAPASNALWAIWFRADTPENNGSLERVRALLGQERLDDAIELATKLTTRAPKFAEAYNQRAIAYFIQGRFDESAADCQRTLELNPYHVGALGGLAQCQVRLDQRREAIKTLRRSLKLQPFGDGLKEMIAALEAQGE